MATFAAIGATPRANADTPDPTNAFIQPAGDADAKPIWGIRDGISVGLWPLPGPRGLLRIYTPYLHQAPGRIFNFIAVEPSVNHIRDLSELQTSSMDHKPGKPMWTTDTLDLQHPAPYTLAPTRGVVTRDRDVAVLKFFLHVEKFDNGSDPIVGITLRSDRPHEVELTTYAAADSAAFPTCTLTATMGNWARLRHLKLKDSTVEALDLFHVQRHEDIGFYPWHQWPASMLTSDAGVLSVSATGDPDPSPEPEEVPRVWRYSGLQAVQTWSTADRPGVVARVNGRSVFWASHAEIPGGPAFENFEMDAPFQPAAVFRYRVEERPAP